MLTRPTKNETGKTQKMVNALHKTSMSGLGILKIDELTYQTPASTTQSFTNYFRGE